MYCCFPFKNAKVQPLSSESTTANTSQNKYKKRISITITDVLGDETVHESIFSLNDTSNAFLPGPTDNKLSQTSLRRRWSLPGPQSSSVGRFKPKERDSDSPVSSAASDSSASGEEFHDDNYVMTPAGPIPKANSVSNENGQGVRLSWVESPTKSQSKEQVRPVSSSSRRRSSLPTDMRVAIPTDLEIYKMKAEIMKKMSQTQYNKGDIIIEKNTIGKEMYFLSKGSVEVLSSDHSKVYTVIEEGSFFGEIGVLFNIPRTATIRAAKPCTCFVLTRNDLESVLVNYPRMSEAIRKRAESVMLKIRVEKAKHFQGKTAPGMNLITEEQE